MSSAAATTNLHVWGYGHSWIVHAVGAGGRWVAMSPWFPSRGLADQELLKLQGSGPEAVS